MKKLVEENGVFKLDESKYWEMFKGSIEKALKSLTKTGWKIVKVVDNDEDGTKKVILKHHSEDSLTWGYVKMFGKIDAFIGISGEGKNLLGIEFLA